MPGKTPVEHYASFVQKLEAFIQDGCRYLLYIEAMEAHDYQISGLATVLIADDDSPTLELYANALKQAYHVITCSTWQEALGILSTQEPQIVVLEPTIAGHRAWELLRDIISVYAVSVIICSALDERRYGLEAGAAAYLVKPVLPSTLLETLKS